MQRADETPDMITIHSVGARREGGRRRSRESQRKMRGEGDGGCRVREHRGSESEEGRERGRRMG